MRTKGIIILGLVAIVAIASIFATSRPARVAYHQWRLAAAIDNARTAGEGKLTAAQEFLALLRGSPATSAEYEEAWQHHEDALVKLNVLTRREFTLTKPVANTDRSRIITAAEREFGAGGPWSVTAALSNSHAVVITAPVAEMSRWEQLIYFYFGQDQRLTDEAAVIRATDNATRWLFERGYRNVLVEINNECNVRYDHEILQPKRMHELIERVRKVNTRQPPILRRHLLRRRDYPARKRRARLRLPPDPRQRRLRAQQDRRDGAQNARCAWLFRQADPLQRG